MSIDPSRIRAVVFDYGNTLIEFSRRQIEYCDGRLGELLTERFGPFDVERFNALRDADRRAPYADGYRENAMPTIARNLVRTLYERDATDEELAAILDCRFEAFADSIEAPEGVHDLLTRLGRRYKLALVSNYPCGKAIRASLDRTALAPHLATVVVSGDVGHVKPHPKPFEAALAALDVQPDEAVYVGDNWLADVQGAKRLGMAAVHIRQWQTPEYFEPEPGDHEPDAVIEHLAELEALLA